MIEPFEPFSIHVLKQDPITPRALSRHHSLDTSNPSFPPAPSDRSSTCLYFSLDGAPPVTDPLLVLNGEGVNSDRPVNNVCFPSAVAPKYAPEGKSLASVTVVGLADGVSDEALASSCKAQLEGWFGESVKEWNFLRSYRIKHSQPGQTPPNGNRFERHPEVSERFEGGAVSQHSKHSTKQHNACHEKQSNKAHVARIASLPSHGYHDEHGYHGCYDHTPSFPRRDRDRQHT